MPAILHIPIHRDPPLKDLPREVGNFGAPAAHATFEFLKSREAREAMSRQAWGGTSLHEQPNPVGVLAETLTAIVFKYVRDVVDSD
jgi:hypothetical protein